MEAISDAQEKGHFGALIKKNSGEKSPEFFVMQNLIASA